MFHILGPPLPNVQYCTTYKNRKDSSSIFYFSFALHLSERATMPLLASLFCDTTARNLRLLSGSHVARAKGRRPSSSSSPPYYAHMPPQPQATPLSPLAQAARPKEGEEAEEWRKPFLSRSIYADRAGKVGKGKGGRGGKGSNRKGKEDGNEGQGQRREQRKGREREKIELFLA